MKTKKKLLSTLLLSALTYISCTKEDAKQIANNNVPLATAEATANVKADVAVDFISVIADDQYEATEASPTTRNAAVAYTSIFASNSSVSVSDAGSTSSVRIRTITFTSCNFKGNLLNGTVILTRPLGTSTTTMTITFENFSVNGNILEGTLNWTRELTGTDQHPKTTLTTTGLKIKTLLTGIFTRTETRYREMTVGFTNRNDRLNDEFIAYGNSTTTHSNSGFEYKTSVSASTPLLFKSSCSTYQYPLSGKLNLTRGLYNAVIDFGTGTGSVACDNLATLSINGGVATEIKLGY